jgi:hypothetical protein
MKIQCNALLTLFIINQINYVYGTTDHTDSCVATKRLEIRKLEILKMESCLRDDHCKEKEYKIRNIISFAMDEIGWTQEMITREFSLPKSTKTMFFEQGICSVTLLHNVVCYYSNNSNKTLTDPLIKTPTVIETHWYDVFFKRPDSGSSSSSKESDRSSGYLKKDLDNDEEKEPLIEKDKTSKKRD